MFLKALADISKMKPKNFADLPVAFVHISMEMLITKGREINDMKLRLWNVAIDEYIHPVTYNFDGCVNGWFSKAVLSTRHTNGYCVFSTYII